MSFSHSSPNPNSKPLYTVAPASKINHSPNSNTHNNRTIDHLGWSQRKGNDQNNNIFSSLNFSFDTSFESKQIELLTKSVTKLGGKVDENLPPTHIVTSLEQYVDVAEQHTITCVCPEWIATCDQHNKLVSVDSDAWMKRSRQLKAQNIAQFNKNNNFSNNNNISSSGQRQNQSHNNHNNNNNNNNHNNHNNHNSKSNNNNVSSGQRQFQQSRNDNNNNNHYQRTSPIPQSQESSQQSQYQRSGQHQNKLSYNFVTLPCDQRNTYIERGTNIEKSCWKKIISMLQAVRNRPTITIEALEAAIRDYNNGFRGNLSNLRLILQDKSNPIDVGKIMKNTIPFIIDLVLDTENIFYEKERIPFLSGDGSSIVHEFDQYIRFPNSKQNYQNKVQKCSQFIWFTHHQVACLLANAFLCTFPGRNSCDDQRQIPSFNFTALHTSPHPKSQQAKLTCILHYFERIRLEQICGQNKKYSWDQLSVGYTLEELKYDFSWEKDVTELGVVHIYDSESITDFHNQIHADFANEQIGGGVIGAGNVQEEIRFSVSPECILSRLFVRYMKPNVSLVIIGAQQYCSFQGYGSEFRFTGDFIDPNAIANCSQNSNRFYFDTHMTCFDALFFSTSSNDHSTSELLEQHHPQNIKRELNKALSAFCINWCSKKPIATGHWGCGVFGGERELKFIIQWMAATVSEREMSYFMFSDKRTGDAVKKFIGVVESWGGLTVQKLFNLLSLYRDHLVECSRTHGDTKKPKPLIKFLTEMILAE